MKRLIIAVLVAVAASGCSSLPDSIKGPFARVESTLNDISVEAPESSPYPKATDQGLF